MAKEAAAIATAWGWKSSDITDKRVEEHTLKNIETIQTGIIETMELITVGI